MRLKTLEVPNETRWGIYALHEQVSRCIECPRGRLECFSTTGATLFGIYIAQQGRSGVGLGVIKVHIMLYANDIILLFKSPPCHRFFYI